MGLRAGRTVADPARVAAASPFDESFAGALIPSLAGFFGEVEPGLFVGLVGLSPVGVAGRGEHDDDEDQKRSSERGLHKSNTGARGPDRRR